MENSLGALHTYAIHVARQHKGQHPNERSWGGELCASSHHIRTYRGTLASRLNQFFQLLPAQVGTWVHLHLLRQTT